MSFVNLGNQSVDLVVRRGYSFGPRTFLYRHGPDWATPYETFANDGYEAQLEVACSKGGESVFVANSEDSGSGLTIDPDNIIVSFELSPSQSESLDFSCCDFVLFIYKGDVVDPDDKVLLVHGSITIEDVGAFEVQS